MSILTPKKLAPPFNPFLHEIWHIQRNIFLHPYGVALNNYAKHPVIIALAEQLTTFYFRQSKKKASSAYEKICHYYVLAILLYPLQASCLQRVYKPYWTLPILCSWLRKAISKHSKQYFFKQIDVPDNYKSESILFSTLKQTSPEWLQFQVNLLTHNAFRDTVSGHLCRLILEPFLYTRHDTMLNQEYGVAESSYRRKVRRKMKMPTASSLRIGRKVWLFGDRICGKEEGWIDLRRRTVKVTSYFLCRYQAKGRKEGLDITIAPEYVRELMAEIKVILESKTTPFYKFHLANRKMRNWGKKISGATGAGKQLFAVDRWYGQKIRKKILPSIQAEQRDNLISKIVDIKKYCHRQLINPINFFHTETVEESQLLAIFSPYR